jgi:hypothetical protein
MRRRLCSLIFWSVATLTTIYAHDSGIDWRATDKLDAPLSGSWGQQ